MAIELSPLHPSLGAEVRGIDVTRPVTPEIFAEIDAAFSRYGVLVFSGQPVTDEQQLAFSRLFGPLEVNPNYTGAKMRLRPDIADISNLDGEGRVLARDDRRNPRCRRRWCGTTAIPAAPASISPRMPH